MHRPPQRHVQSPEAGSDQGLQLAGEARPLSFRVPAARPISTAWHAAHHRAMPLQYESWPYMPSAAFKWRVRCVLVTNVPYCTYHEPARVCVRVGKDAVTFSWTRVGGDCVCSLCRSRTDVMAYRVAADDPFALLADQYRQRWRRPAIVTGDVDRASSGHWTHVTVVAPCSLCRVHGERV